MGRTEAIVADVEAAVRPLRDRQRGCQTHTRQGCRDLRTRQLPQDAVDRRPRLPPSHSMRWAPERSLGHRRRGSGTTPATATVSGRTIRGQSGTAAARRTLDGSAAADSQIGRRHFGAVDPPPPAGGSGGIRRHSQHAPRPRQHRTPVGRRRRGDPLAPSRYDGPGLRRTNRAREAADTALETQIANVATVPQNLLDLANYVSVDLNTINDLMGPHVMFSGANVHIQNGFPP
jgi:hypothetical protein